MSDSRPRPSLPAGAATVNGETGPGLLRVPRNRSGYFPGTAKTENCELVPAWSLREGLGPCFRFGHFVRPPLIGTSSLLGRPAFSQLLRRQTLLPIYIRGLDFSRPGPRLIEALRTHCCGGTRASVHQIRSAPQGPRGGEDGCGEYFPRDGNNSLLETEPQIRLPVDAGARARFKSRRDFSPSAGSIPWAWAAATGVFGWSSLARSVAEARPPDAVKGAHRFGIIRGRAAACPLWPAFTTRFC